MDSPLIITASELINPATALVVDSTLFIVPTGAEYEVMEVLESHTVAGTNGSDVTVYIGIVASGSAPDAAQNVQTSTFNLKSTANTPVSKVPNNGLLADASLRRMRSGTRLIANFTGTLTALEGLNITVVLKRLRHPQYR